MVTAAAVLIAGCGQRGDLYLPTPQKTGVPPDAGGNANCIRPGDDTARGSAAGTACTASGN